MSSQRSISTVVRPQVHHHGGGLVTTDLGGPDLAASLDPFIMVSLYEMTAPTFPPHPHAGFSVATYILPESPIGFVNQDTLGNRNLIAPGALHVTVAGRGVQHEEQPARLGSLARGYQIWIDHRDADREVKPQALHLSAGETPVTRHGGALIRVALGESNGLRSPLEPPTPVRLVDVALESGAAFAQSLGSDETCFVVVLEGAITIDGTSVAAGQVAFADRGGVQLTAKADDGVGRFTLFAGNPLASQRLHGGPFVASSAAQLQRFVERFRAGELGELTPFSAQPD